MNTQNVPPSKSLEYRAGQDVHYTTTNEFLKHKAKLFNSINCKKRKIKTRSLRGRILKAKWWTIDSYQSLAVIITHPLHTFLYFVQGFGKKRTVKCVQNKQRWYYITWNVNTQNNPLTNILSILKTFSIQSPILFCQRVYFYISWIQHTHYCWYLIHKREKT